MDRVWQFVRSPEFIVGGIVFGFLISVVANFATKALDRSLGKYFDSRKQKLEKRTAARAQRVDAMARDYETLTHYRHYELRTRIDIITLFVLFAVVFILVLILRDLELREPAKVPGALSAAINQLTIASVVGAVVGMGLLFALGSRVKQLKEDLNQAAKARRHLDTP
jgi:uncharacterized membrane-anchored protein YhcB (DUF1043 family)